eukprot:CAMPEP_0116870216 /NCGR_PEP_ID=MMETSP0463-20121206/81_1 /TAXON_ID=181622 /ORGANISM="Strombidinopsis sp, Strain SopsisLIS2011" /LENGTH=108 /DNA_ID=CAMNT_0004506445 /DNA_START=1203 /DNA_END=1530 /DNA_ORIENTATION=+
MGMATADWTTPVLTWERVQCSSGGTGTYSYKEGISYGQEVTNEVTASVSREIEMGTRFGSTTTSREMSYSLSNMLSYTTDTEVSHTFTCYENEDGTEFEGGCLYQQQL